MSLRRFLRFGLSGIIATSVAYVSFPLIFTVMLHNQHYTVAFIAASVINVTVSFLLQKFFVFRSERAWLREYLRFWLGSAAIIVVGYFATAALISRLSLSPLVANAVVVTFAAISSYLFHNHVTFGSKPLNQEKRV